MGNTNRQYAMGFTKEGYEMEIPHGTQPGDIITVPDKGMPGINTKKRGKLLVHYIFHIQGAILPMVFLSEKF